MNKKLLVPVAFAILLSLAVFVASSISNFRTNDFIMSEIKPHPLGCGCSPLF